MRPTGRSQAFSLNAALGFFGMGLGTLIGSAVPLFARFLPGPTAYEPLFVLNLVAALVTTWMIGRLQEAPRRAAGQVPAAPAARVGSGRAAARGSAAPTAVPSEPAEVPAAGRRAAGPLPAGPAPAATATTPPPRAAPAFSGAGEAAALRRRENVALTLLSTVNSVNALGIGLIGPLMPYWFAVRFGVGPEAIGSVYALTFFLTAISSVVTGEVGARVGVVRSIVGPRTVGVFTLLAMPLMPAYAWAAALYAFRSILNRGTAGTRQAFSMALVRDERRGLAGSLNALSFRMPSAVGAAAAGWLMGLGLLDLPFFLAAGLQFAYVVLFGLVLKPYENGT
ncbi:MAG: hypothetical protein P8Y05_05610 [Deinococcales bacterium]